jgi:phage-related minor tail protein
MSLPALLSLAILVAVGAWIAAPLFRSDAIEAERAARQLSERSELLSRKEQMLQALRDLEDDRETGKINDHDYRELHARLTAETAEVLAKMDEIDAAETADVVRAHPSAAPPRT